MIKLDDEYIITADSNCYYLQKCTNKKDKNGKDIRVTTAYCTTLEYTLKAYANIKLRKKISVEENMTLKDVQNEIVNYPSPKGNGLLRA